MKLLISIEQKLERVRHKKNDPRTCDLDIIDYKKKIINFKMGDDNLNIPHKRMNLRNFVLYPLREISPSWTHPISKKNISFLIDNLTTPNNEITKLSLNDIIGYVK